jgi:hypothetical protein
MPARAGIAAAAAALVLWGCGAQPPQAPVTQANRVASALTSIAAACGLSYQERERAPRGGASAAVQSEAVMRSEELAHVYRMNPEWVYQGATLREVVALAVSYLRECHLSQAADALVRKTSG